MSRSGDGSYARWKAARKAQSDARAGRPDGKGGLLMQTFTPAAVEECKRRNGAYMPSQMDVADDYARFDFKAGVIRETARLTLRQASERNDALRDADLQPGLERWITLKSARETQAKNFPEKVSQRG